MKRYFCRVAKGAIKRSSEITDTRECSGCRLQKKTSEAFYFHTTKAGKTIPDRMCKECKYKWFVEYRRKRKQKYAEYAKKARAVNPEHHATKRKAYRATPRSKAYDRAYAEKHRDRNREAARIRGKTEAGRIAKLEKIHRRRSAKENALTPLSHLITDRWISDLFSKYDNRCVYCGEVSQMTLDHVVPISRGGKHEALNLVPACHLCNSVKRNKLVDEWRPWVVIPGYGLDLATA